MVVQISHQEDMINYNSNSAEIEKCVLKWESGVSPTHAKDTDSEDSGIRLYFSSNFFQVKM